MFDQTQSKTSTPHLPRPLKAIGFSIVLALSTLTAPALVADEANMTMQKVTAKINAVADNRQARTELATWALANARQDNVQAIMILSQMYAKGTVFPARNDVSVDWLRRAAELGHADAQYALGKAFIDGRGRRVSTPSAKRWYAMAAAQNHADAMNALKALN